VSAPGPGPLAGFGIEAAEVQGSARAYGAGDFERTDGQFLAANEAAVLFLGYAPEGFAALTPRDIHSIRDSQTRGVPGAGEGAWPLGRRRNTLASAQLVGASHPDRLVAQRADVIIRSMTVDGFNRGGDVVIEIVDNGSGLPKAVRAELFSEKGFSASGGAGLGLMIAAELAANHGGRLELAETSPHGTRFRLVLPTKVAEAN
jgi:hypothetical protein